MKTRQILLNVQRGSAVMGVSQGHYRKYLLGMPSRPRGVPGLKLAKLLTKFLKLKNTVDNVGLLLFTSWNGSLIVTHHNANGRYQG